jgi:hypothetical protein
MRNSVLLLVLFFALFPALALSAQTPVENGIKLEKPVLIHVAGAQGEVGKRSVFKGYETLIQLGVPQAINQARKEAGQSEMPVPAAGFGFHSCFEVLSVVLPKDVKQRE